MRASINFSDRPRSADQHSRERISHRLVGSTRQSLADRFGKTHRLDAGPHDEGGEVNRLLAVVRVKLGGRFVVEPVMLRVADDADDHADRVVVVEQLDLFADGILAGPEAPRHRLIDQEDQRRPGAVFVTEKAALHERDLDSAEIIGRRD